RAAALADPSELGLEQPGLRETVEVECHQLSAHPECGSRRVPPDGARARGHEFVQPSPVRLVEEGDRGNGVVACRRSAGRCQVQTLTQRAITNTVDGRPLLL